MAADAPRVRHGARWSDGGSADDASACRRVRGEYREMPGLLLTDTQAGRLLGLQLDVCRDVLATLVGEGFLMRARDGRYGREGACPRCQ